jgi:hypothetical protein
LPEAPSFLVALFEEKGQDSTALNAQPSRKIQVCEWIERDNANPHLASEPQGIQYGG